MPSSTVTPPRPPSERGVHQGRPYWLWLPEGEGPWPAMLILHGAGSRKENHADFARLCAGRGWAALAYDQRGHGEAADEMGPGALDDVGRMARFLAERPDVDGARVCVRGSSMGGNLAVHAAAAFPHVSGAIAICPAGEEQLLRGVRSGELGFRAGERARAELAAWLARHDLREAAARVAPKPLILLHASGDERVPVELSEELYARAGEPKELVVVLGGHHRSVQHDPGLQAKALRWLERNLPARGAGG